MAYVLEVPLSPETREILEAEAKREGKNPADFVAGVLMQQFSVARNAPPLTEKNVTEGSYGAMTFHTFDLEAVREKSGLPKGRTSEEIADAAEGFLATADSATLARMTQRGLL